jgi:hypothetical protein
MLTLEELNQISSLMLSDNVTYKGTQMQIAFNLLQRLEQEKKLASAPARLTPKEDAKT